MFFQFFSYKKEAKMLQVFLLGSILVGKNKNNFYIIKTFLVL